MPPEAKREVEEVTAIVEEIEGSPEDIEEVETGQELEVYDASDGQVVARPPGNLFGTVDDPEGTVEKASRHARALAKVIEEQKLFSDIQGKKHVRVEGWTLLGSMLGVFPVMVDSGPVTVRDRTDPAGTAYVEGYEATIEARTLTGALVGRAKAYCLRNERRWAKADDYALLSMAQTRATSRALRGPLGFIIELAGYNATAAEEMPATPAVPLSQRMRTRIEELARESDKIQEREPGTTWNALLEQVKLNYGCEVHELNVDDLRSVGMGLSRHREQAAADKGLDFALSNLDVIFGESFTEDPYA